MSEEEQKTDVPEEVASRIRSLVRKADSHYRQGHRLRAIWNYRKALQLDPHHVVALVNLGLIYSTTKGKGGKALELLRRALDREPENPTILFNLATLTAHSGDIRGAVDLLERAERIDPKYADLHYNKAYLFTQLGDWEAARREVEMELRYNPGNFNAKVMKEAIDHRQRQADKGAENLSRESSSCAGHE